MRGRTLNHAFIILDEAQNTTPEQMKMFLTRLGFGAKAVITGDITQIDLPRGQKSGLVEAQHVLRDVRGVAFTRLPAPTSCAIRWWRASSMRTTNSTPSTRTPDLDQEVSPPPASSCSMPTAARARAPQTRCACNCPMGAA